MSRPRPALKKASSRGSFKKSKMANDDDIFINNIFCSCCAKAIFRLSQEGEDVLSLLSVLVSDVPPSFRMPCIIGTLKNRWQTLWLWTSGRRTWRIPVSTGFIGAFLNAQAVELCTWSCLLVCREQHTHVGRFCALWYGAKMAVTQAGGAQLRRIDYGNEES